MFYSSDVAPSHDIDVAVLFEKYTVDEIRDIEKKTRQVVKEDQSSILMICIWFE